jgi:RNA polymerase sigma-70 factor (ECF subfamily)
VEPPFDEQLFRREAGRMVSALTRVFGVHNLALAEDVVQDALCRALEVWKLRGVPENPSAWLMATAKNRALDALRRERTARTFAPELSRMLDSEWTLAPATLSLFAARSIEDDQLRMMFSCCHPRLAEEAQIALVLNILCGFSVEEIASALLAGEAGIEKRITRSKKVLAGSTALFELGDGELGARLSAVQRALYLLFNEGYHGANPVAAVRVELCDDARRLVALLCSEPRTATPATHALAALMCLHAARLPARLDDGGELRGLFEQDRARWDQSLVSEGIHWLDLSARGEELSEYHVEAAIAAVHARARSAEETDWRAIVGLYDTLAVIRPSPVVALSRAIAVAQEGGPEQGIAAIAAIEDKQRLHGYPFYFAALGELELRCGHDAQAREHFERALGLARSPHERRFLEQRVAACAVGASAGPA